MNIFLWTSNSEKLLKNLSLINECLVVVVVMPTLSTPALQELISELILAPVWASSPTRSSVGKAVPAREAVRTFLCTPSAVFLQ